MFNQDNPSSEYQLALSHLITDINITDHSGDVVPVVDGPIELSGEKKHVTYLDLQAHRGKPSKDRAKRFAAGDIASDLPVPDHYDLQEFQYWAILPLLNEL